MISHYGKYLQGQLDLLADKSVCVTSLGLNAPGSSVFQSVSCAVGQLIFGVVFMHTTHVAELPAE